MYIVRDYYIKGEPAFSQELQLSMSLSTRHPGESWIRCQPAARVGLDAAAIRLFDDSLLLGENFFIPILCKCFPKILFHELQSSTYPFSSEVVYTC